MDFYRLKLDDIMTITTTLVDIKNKVNEWIDEKISIHSNISGTSSIQGHVKVDPIFDKNSNNPISNKKITEWKDQKEQQIINCQSNINQIKNHFYNVWTDIVKTDSSNNPMSSLLSSDYSVKKKTNISIIVIVNQEDFDFSNKKARIKINGINYEKDLSSIDITANFLNNQNIDLTGCSIGISEPLPIKLNSEHTYLAQSYVRPDHFNNQLGLNIRHIYVEE